MKDLQWHEPAAYRRAIFYENEKQDPLSSLKFAGAAFGFMLGLRFLAGTGPDAHPPPWWPHSVGVALAVAIFAAYGLPGLMSLLPGSIVILSDKGVNSNKIAGRGWIIRFWPWDEIAYGSLTTDTAGGKVYQVLCLHGADNHVLATLALSPRATMHQIQPYFSANGKSLVTVQTAR